MKRKQIYIEDELDAGLKSAAVAEGRSAAAIVRDAVRAYLTQPDPTAQDDPFLRLAGTVRGGPADASTDHDRYLYRDAR